MPKLTSLTLSYLSTNLRDFTFPSLTQFNFMAGTSISVRDLTSFFERCPSLELIRIRLSCQPPTHPPRRRVCLPALKELRLDQSACITGLLDHLILPKCTEIVLKGRQFTDKTLDAYGEPAARIHPSSIAHLPVMRGITKAVTMPRSCTLSGPNGNLAFWCFEGTREHFDADFFTSFSPISVLQIKELWIGRESRSGRKHPREQTAAGVQGASGVLTKVEDLTIVSGEMGAIFAALGATVDGGILLPRLQSLTIYVGRGNLDVLSLIQCAKARGSTFSHSRR